MSLLPHFIDEKTKRLSFTSKVVMMAIATWIESFPDDYRGLSCRCEESSIS